MPQLHWGVIRRHGLGRLRHIDCAYLWVQEQSALKKLTFDKVAGAKNPSDSLTKFVGFDTLMTHMQMLACDYPQGENSFGFKLHGSNSSVSSIGRRISIASSTLTSDVGVVHSCSGKALESLEKLLSKIGRPDSKIWSRHDIGIACFRGSCKGGPDWDQVTGRLTMLASDGKVLECRRIENIPRNEQHGKLPTGRSDIVTYLTYVEDQWKARGEAYQKSVRTSP